MARFLPVLSSAVVFVSAHINVIINDAVAALDVSIRVLTGLADCRLRLAGGGGEWDSDSYWSPRTACFLGLGGGVFAGTRAESGWVVGNVRQVVSLAGGVVGLREWGFWAVKKNTARGKYFVDSRYGGRYYEAVLRVIL
ncbi:MAG TPA: hypothetical protein VMW16_13285 [Sedimentisphaerales bacterium]|nr:hypothetical protein [Sedimentisphaerales bacterium]